MAANKVNKSLFLYTALIFFAAILIIIVAFFGQANLERSQPVVDNNETTHIVEDGITQKAAVLSEQNTLLITQNDTLTKLNNELYDDVNDLEAENEELKINYSNGNVLCSVYQYIYDKNYDDAQVALNSINVDSLTDAQKIIYANLTKILD